MNNIDDARSGTDSQNLQEILDAAVSGKHALQGGQQQYQTPSWLAKSCAGLLPFNPVGTVYDPQCAGGNLLMSVQARNRYGTEIDNRFNSDTETMIARIQGNCVRFWQVYDEVYPNENVMKFACIVANPPFGIRWKLGEGESIESTEWTWAMINRRLIAGGCGYFIANANTIEKLEINTHPWVYLYQRFPAGGIWDDCNVELGIVHFTNTHGVKRLDHKWDTVPTAWEISGLGAMIELSDTAKYAPYAPYFDYQWVQMDRIMKEESGRHSKWNIYLNEEGYLRTYLSTRLSMKIKREDVHQLSKINGCHPLTLTTERESRKVLQRFLTDGIYTIQPEARQAITDALAEVATLACPIRPPNDFSLVAYTEEEDEIKCIALDPTGRIRLTPGNFYELKTATYNWSERYTRVKLHTEEDTGETTQREHDCELHGIDRYIEIVDDRGHIHRFMDKPRAGEYEHAEARLWQMFGKPYVPTVKEVCNAQYLKNLSIMRTNEILNSFTYFPGQLDYYARVGCKDSGLIGADVGTGKTIGALTMIQLKSPARTLIIAPQGTMRSSGEEDDEDYQASQWVQEIRRFASTEPVFQLFSVHDYRNILHANGGVLPNGIFITYPQAYFTNNGFEWLPDSWDRNAEEKFCKRMNLEFDEDRQPDDWFCRGVGREHKGIRCIAEPSLHTIMDSKHGSDMWTMVEIDEAHLICNLDSHITQNVIRLQPKYRYALTATPIPNIVSNIFSLMGWLCVPGWYKGDTLNAAWPYATKDIGRFNSTFLSTEIDKTAEMIAKAKGKKRPSCARTSPVISSPARLLKLLAPNMAYISKEDCNPNMQPCEVIDVRVKMGRQQSKLYGYWLDRKNYLNEFKSALTIAMVQSSRLRGVCASPATLDYTKDMAHSNFNPKTITILGLIKDCLDKGEQVVVVAARKGQTAEIAQRLTEAGIPVARIDSTVKAEFHSAEANRFKKGDARVMLMGIKCAQGHSFDQCPNLIIASLEWSYGTLHQAKGRVWRLTSPKPVKVWCVLHKGTIEELLFDRVATKQDAATICLRGQRVPRDFKTFDATEVLAEHILNYDSDKQDTMSEVECEAQWPELRRLLTLTSMPNQVAA